MLAVAASRARPGALDGTHVLEAAERDPRPVVDRGGGNLDGAHVLEAALAASAAAAALATTSRARRGAAAAPIGLSAFVL
jgi:hypothetical protein